MSYTIFLKDEQEKFEDRLISGEYIPTGLSKEKWEKLEREVKYFLKYGKDKP